MDPYASPSATPAKQPSAPHKGREPIPSDSPDYLDSPGKTFLPEKGKELSTENFSKKRRFSQFAEAA